MAEPYRSRRAETNKNAPCWLEMCMEMAAERRQFLDLWLPMARRVQKIERAGRWKSEDEPTFEQYARRALALEGRVLDALRAMAADPENADAMPIRHRLRPPARRKAAP